MPWRLRALVRRGRPLGAGDRARRDGRLRGSARTGSGGSALARAPVPSAVVLCHGVRSETGVRCAASPSIVAPMLRRVSTTPSAAGESTPAPPRAGIPDSRLPGPFPVGEYAAALRSQLRSFAHVQLMGELVNLRVSRARVYFELRDVERRDPVRGMAPGLGSDDRPCGRTAGGNAGGGGGWL